MENLKNLEKIAKIFQPQNIITSEEIDQVLKGIMEILASYKKGTDAINEETKAVVNSLLEQTIKYNQETISEFKSEAEKAHAERMKELQGFLSEVKTTLGDMEAMMSEVKDGKDADEERVIDEVINRIKIDPTVVTMSAEEVRDKLASLKDDDRLDKSAIKGLEKVLQQKDLDYAVATLQHQASFLINKGGLKVVSHDASLSGDGTPESPLKVESASGLTLQTDGVANGSQTLLNLVAGTNVTLTDNGTGSVTIDATGGSGSPGGSTTQLQYNNAGAFGGISGATTNGTAVTYTTGNLIATDVKASGSGGLHLHNNTGQDCFLSGVGGGINNTAYGALKADYATATTVPYFDASKNLISSAVTPTELGYVSGVTSSIQTQLNAKGSGTVTNVSSANADISVANQSTTPTMTLNSDTAATASTIAKRDANGILTGINFNEGYSTTATAAGTTTLTVGSNPMQYFTGTTTQTVVMPVTSTLVLGQSWWITNRSTGLVTVNSSGGNAIIILAAGTSAEITCILTSGTTAASWDAQYFGANAATGKKVTVNNTLTLAGTDNTTMTFPSTSATIARTDAANTFTGVQTMTSPSHTTSVVTDSTTMAVYNTTATTVNAFGAATTLNVGGTPTTAITHNYSTNATATATTKTVNLGTGGAAGSTSNINIGSANGGTTTVNSPTISLGGTTGATTTGTIELGNASDTTISRSSAGVIAVEGVVVPTISSTSTLTNKTLTNPTINGATITGDFKTDGLPDTDDTWTGKSTNSFNAAGTVAQFDCVYMTSSSTWALTDADAIGTAGNVLVMMAGEAGTVSNPLRVIEPGSWVRNDAWNWTVGGVLYLDTATPGGMTQTAPSGEDDAVKIVGHAVSADVIYFNPSPNWIIYKA